VGVATVAVERTYPNVSILTSYYKGDKFLLKFLENVANQDMFPNCELVIDLNDPTDNELMILKNFELEHPGAVNMSINRTVVPMSVSLNNCIVRSKAEFACIWNIDDRRTNNSISSQYEIIKGSKNINAVYGPFITTSDYDSQNGKYIDNSKIPNLEFTRSMLMGPFFMFRKNIVEKINYFDEQFISAADFDFAVRLAFVGEVRSTQNLLGYFLDSQSGLSTKLDSVGPVERSVIQLRYGILGLFNVVHIPFISDYVIPQIKFRNEWIPVENTVENYKSIKFRELSRAPKSNNTFFRQSISLLRRNLSKYFF